MLALWLAAASLSLWLLARPPDPEAVFWQTVEGNLRSKSVSLQTEVRLDLPDRPGSLVLEDRWEMVFGEAPQARLSQQALFYDRLFSQQTGSDWLEQLGEERLEQLPEQVWYGQSTRIRPEAVWASHDLSARPPVDDDGWLELFSDGTEVPAVGGGWRKFSGTEAAQWQHFLMATASYSGFFYGRLDNPLQRAEVMEHLRQAYRVDFEKVRSVQRQGRLLYEYRVAFDQQALGRAFISYFNLHLAASEADDLRLPPELAANVFLLEGIEHTVLIDARTRQITGISQPISIGPGWFVRELTGSFIVAPLLAPVVGNASFEGAQSLSLETRLVSQNQRLEVLAPVVGREED